MRPGNTVVPELYQAGADQEAAPAVRLGHLFRLVRMLLQSIQGLSWLSGGQGWGVGRGKGWGGLLTET